MVIFLFVTALSYSSSDICFDLWARLLQGDFVLQNGTVMFHDPFSYVKVHDWIDHEWGSGVIFAFFLKHFGYRSLVNLKAVLFFLTFFFTFKSLQLNNTKSLNTLNLLFFFFVINSFETIFLTGIRCHSFTFLLFSVFLFILEEVRKNNKNKLLYILPFLTVLWGNLHGGCVSGIGLILIYFIGEALNKKPCKKYLYTFFAVVPALLINPYGLPYIKFLLHATTMPRPLISEWQNIFETGAFLLLKSKIFTVTAVLTMFVSLFKTIKSKNTIDYTKYLTIITTCYLACAHIKHFPFFIIAAAVFLYSDFIEICIKIFRSDKFSKPFNIIKETFIYLFVILGSISVLYSCYANIISKESLRNYPVKVAEFMKINELKGNILNKFDTGSYLAYKLYPQNLIYMDGRYEEVYYDETTSDNYNFYNNEKNAFEIFNHEGFSDYIIIKKDDLILRELKNFPVYKEIFDADDFILYARIDKLKDKYIQPAGDDKYYIENCMKKFGDKT